MMISLKKSISNVSNKADGNEKTCSGYAERGLVLAQYPYRRYLIDGTIGLGGHASIIQQRLRTKVTT